MARPGSTKFCWEHGWYGSDKYNHKYQRKTEHLYLDRSKERQTYPIGKTFDMFQGKDRTRELVRIRDNRTCQNCKRVWQDGERRFDVHHLNGVCGKKSNKYDSVSEMDGLITYCHRCHMTLDEVRKKIREKTSQRPSKQVKTSSALLPLT